ncbi:MAG TPA: prepilin-type N-terminal cleavage/methylation domain-containing protein [Gemmatimonadales bacterium]|nr:prepilin-type N-terminal cleavage/methylation domain-containing protein [Gemmatimonadales bacterium]
MTRERGFTIVEVIVAILVLTVGLLGLVTSSALVTRMIGRGQRSAVAATYALRRLEVLRQHACLGGGDTVRTSSGPWVIAPAGAAIDTVGWSFDSLTIGSPALHVVVRSTYQTASGKWRKDSVETEVSCLR